MKIAVDLGHGVGHDRGADGVIPEEVVINEVGSLVINQLRELGHEVIETRPSNSDTVLESLAARVDRSNTYLVDLFISIHANAGGGHGTEVFTFRGKEIPQARNVLNNLVSLGFTNRGIKGESLYVTSHTVASSMLVEICFVDTQSDIDLYKSIGSSRIAAAIINGLTGDVVSEPTSTPEPISSNTGTVTADVLNVRETPGGSIIGTLSNGDVVKIDREDGDWYSIFFGDHGGYVSKKYVAVNGQSQSYVPTLDGAMGTVMATQLNVRDSIMGSIVGTLSKGNTVRICRQEGNWYHIYYGNNGAWVCSDYISI